MTYFTLNTVVYFRQSILFFFLKDYVVRTTYYHVRTTYYVIDTIYYVVHTRYHVVRMRYVVMWTKYSVMWAKYTPPAKKKMRVWNIPPYSNSNWVVLPIEVDAITYWIKRSCLTYYQPIRSWEKMEIWSIQNFVYRMCSSFFPVCSFAFEDFEGYKNTIASY